MASGDVGTFYYDELVRAIGAMAQVLETGSLELYKNQCRQMIQEFLYVRDCLEERKEILRTNGTNSSSILKELYRQTFAANAVLRSCCCCVKLTQDNKTVVYSWLQAAVTQSDEAVFKVIWDELKWCSRLVKIFATGLDDAERKELIEADKQDLKQKLEALLAVQEENSLQNVELARFLLSRFNGDGKHILFANDCESDNVWSRKQSLNELGHTMTSSVIAIDWFGVKLARKTFRNQPVNGDCLVEREIMAPLNHPNVVRFISCDHKGDPAILMEYMEGNLQEYLKKRAKEEYAAQPSGWVGRGVRSIAGSNILEVVDMMYQIALAMAYLHGQGVAHCDIKPSNVLLNPCREPGFEAYVQLKLADFGVSKSGLNECLIDSSKDSRGTTNYRAPELRGRARNVDFKKADLFSYALTCWHILHGKLPFAGMELGTLHQEQLKGVRPPIDPDVPAALAALIGRCWSTTPEDRPTFSEVCLALQNFKEELLLGTVPTTLISVPENKTKRRWNAIQSSYMMAVKILTMRFLCSQSSSYSEQGETGDRNWRFGARGCFLRPESSEDLFVYPGDRPSANSS